MALLETYGEVNRVVETGLSVSYSKTRTFGYWHHVMLNVEEDYTEAWTYRRRATKSYRYVGMTYEAAQTCAADMRKLYNRDQKMSVWDLNDNREFAEPSTPNKVVMADVAVTYAGGSMYDVRVEVNEDDERMRRASLAPDALFTAEKSRDYDGESEAGGAD